MTWHLLTGFSRSENNVLSGNVQFPKDCAWFCGHFPDEPILPGVAQMGIVFDVIDRLTQGHVQVTEVSRVRFKKVIRPDETLNVTATPMANKPGGFMFTIMSDQELVCSGNIMVNIE